MTSAGCRWSSRDYTVRIATLVLLAGVGCETRGDMTRDDGLISRDSAGTQIVVNAQPENMLSTTPVLRIGVMDGDPTRQFSRIRSLAVDTAGGIWVVDSHETVRRFDSAGSHAGSVGGAGRGPGEAEGYSNAWAGADDLLVWGEPSVIQRFGLDGQFLGSRQAYTDDGRVVSPIGYAAGQWYFAVEEFRPGSADLARTTIHIAAAPDLSASADTLTLLSGELRKRHFRTEFGNASYFLGNPSYVVDGTGRLFVSDTLEYRISVHDKDGKLLRVLQRRAAERRYDDGWQSEIEEAVAAAASRDGALPADRATVELLMSSIIPSPAPAHLPFIQRLLAGPAGDLWVERADRHPNPGMRAVAHAFGYVRYAWRPEWKAPQIFDIFDPSGVYRGTVQLPADYQAMAVTANRVYGVEYDELGVEYVVVRELSTAQ